MTGIARQTQYQQVHYLRKRVNYNDAGVSTGVLVGTVPAGADILGASCKVFTAFNAGTTNVLTVGMDASYLNLIAAADVTEGTPGHYDGAKTNAGFFGILAVDTDVFAKYTQTGTAATTGQADIHVTYAPNNDG